MRIIFAGGGTGGHLFPAIAIADEVRALRPDADILFVGTRDKLEARLVPQRGYGFRPIWISGFHRSLRVGNLVFPLKVIVSLMQAVSIIRKFKPSVVVGTGGYVSGPVLRAATLLKVPTIIQEQNGYPGVTTRLLAGKVTEVHLTFEGSRKYFRRIDNLFVTGNPTRSDLELADRIEAYHHFGLEPSSDMTTLLVFGGSLGAHTINQAVERHCNELMKHKLRLIWQTGRDDLQSAREVVRQYSPERAWVGPFIDRMDFAYAASDLVICRAGATSIAEITRLGKPVILVPYPFAAASHQVENARMLADAGVAEIVFDDEVSKKLVRAVLEMLGDPPRLARMSEQSKKLGRPDAARIIAQRIVRLATISRRGKG